MGAGRGKGRVSDGNIRVQNKHSVLLCTFILYFGIMAKDSVIDRGI